MKERDNVIFYITPFQASSISNYFGKDVDDLENYEISEMLDDIIDRLETDGGIN